MLDKETLTIAARRFAGVELVAVADVGEWRTLGAAYGSVDPATIGPHTRVAAHGLIAVQDPASALLGVFTSPDLAHAKFRSPAASSTIETAPESVSPEGAA